MTLLTLKNVQNGPALHGPPSDFYFLLFPFSSFSQEPVKDTAAYDTLTMAVVGDLMCHAPQFNAAKKDSGYDFRPVYAAVKPYLENADLTF